MGNVVRMVADSFRNLVTGLNTGAKDKQAAGDYCLLQFAEWQWTLVYRASWLARKTVAIPAQDATRKWREWKAEAKQIEAIEAEEKRLLIPQRVFQAMLLGRLHGGAGLYAGVRDNDPSTPLNLKSVKKGDLEFINLLPRTVLTPGPIELDPISLGYGKPKYWEVSGTAGGQRIHPSRLSIFQGNELLDPTDSTNVIQGWSDSVLQAAYEAIRDGDSVASNSASLVYESKIDVLKIPELTELMNNELDREALQERIRLSALLKGNNGLLVIDKEEEYEQKTFNFAGVSDIGYQALQQVSGASDIPLTRFLGQTPAGLSSTGESDLKNYYDAVSSGQELVLTPAITNLDELIIRSALGDRDSEIHYKWSSLWQMSDEQKSKIAKETAETIDTLAKTALFDDDSLSEASVNLLNERGVLPGLELRTDPVERESVEIEGAELGGTREE